MDKYYSQHGEDFLINKIFDQKKNGFFVEIGCVDGIEFSNSYFFEKRGWQGICVEAHNDFIELLKENRKGAKIIHCAVGEKNADDVIFYANKIGSLSTLDKTEEKRWKEHFNEYFTGFEEQHVEMKTLTSIFDELNVSQIDFISLDIEGYEVKALSGLDIFKYRPRLFIIEYKDDDHKKDLERILFPKRYAYLGKIGCNLFYSTELKDKKIINKNYGKQKLVRVDKNGIEQSVDILLNHPSTFQKVVVKAKYILKTLLKPFVKVL